MRAGGTQLIPSDGKRTGRTQGSPATHPFGCAALAQCDGAINRSPQPRFDGLSRLLKALTGLCDRLLDPNRRRPTDMTAGRKGALERERVENIVANQRRELLKLRKR